MSDKIPTVETYRGVDIHSCQPQDRIERTVKPAIDHVLATAAILDLVAYAADVTKPPEARLLAAAKIEAMYSLAAADRVVRPAVDLDRVRASVPGLNSRRRRSPRGYGSVLDVPPAPGKPSHAMRPPEYARQVEADRREGGGD